ncbi:hypothetical protein SBADM41S_05974 [Streptomyces badius]
MGVLWRVSGFSWWTTTASSPSRSRPPSRPNRTWTSPAAGSGPAALRALERAAAEGRGYDVLLVDAELGAQTGGGELPAVPAPRQGEAAAVDGIALVAGVRAARPGVRSVVLAEKDDPRAAARALQAGASGWVAKDCSLQRLLSVIRGVLRDETHLPPALLTGVLRELTAARKHRSESERLVESLTPREHEVLRCMVAGLGRKAVAERLFLSRTRCAPICRTCWASSACTRHWQRWRWPAGRGSAPSARRRGRQVGMLSNGAVNWRGSRGQFAALGAGQLAEDGALLVEESGQRLVGLVAPLGREPYEDATPVVRVGQPLDEVLLGEPVDAVGHRARGDQGLGEELPGGELVRGAGPAQRREHVELPRLQVVLGEGYAAGPVEVACQAGDAAEHLEWFHVEVGALAAPCSDQSVDLVLHVDQCRGSLDMKSLEIKRLDIKIRPP